MLQLRKYGGFILGISLLVVIVSQTLISFLTPFGDEARANSPCTLFAYLCSINIPGTKPEMLLYRTLSAYSLQWNPTPKPRRCLQKHSFSLCEFSTNVDAFAMPQAKHHCTFGLHRKWMLIGKEVSLWIEELKGFYSPSIDVCQRRYQSWGTSCRWFAF